MDLDGMHRDCERLLEQLAMKRRKAYKTRARALPAVIRLLGYKLKWRDEVPEDVFGFTHFKNKEVVLPRDLAERMDFPQSLDAFLNATLAHELGHIRLHATAALQGHRSAKWEDEAYAYSCAFLVPYRDLMSQPEAMVIRAGLIQDQDNLWKNVLRLAELYEVSGAFMATALQRYEVIEFDVKTRVIRPCTVLGRKITRAQRIWDRLALRFASTPSELPKRNPRLEGRSRPSCP